MTITQQNSANDGVYRLKRARTLPLQHTMTYIQGYPEKLKIYLTNASSFWQVRCFHKGKVYTRSLKTTRKSRAMCLARDFFDELMARFYVAPMPEIGGTGNAKYSFKLLAEQTIESERARVIRGEFAHHSLTMLRSRLYKHVIPYFANRNIQDIDYEAIAKFTQHLSKLKLSSITITQYLIALRKVFNYALAKELINKVPLLPKVKVSSTPRGGFDLDEYKILIRTAKNLSKIKDEHKEPTHRNKAGGIYTARQSVPKEMAWLIGFMVNSFVRPVDIKLMQHKHIQIIRGDHIYLRLTLPETKRHKLQIVTLRPAVRIYEALKSYMSKRGLASADDYLFLPEIKDREAAVYLMGKYFRNILEQTGLRDGSLGQKRTIYSLRHTAIMFRLLYGRGIDLLTLARNARTSVDMIERFYASNLTAEMNIELLQSRR
jgi:site-specific recombinase XerD